MANFIAWKNISLFYVPMVKFEVCSSNIGKKRILVMDHREKTELTNAKITQSKSSQFFF